MSGDARLVKLCDTISSVASYKGGDQSALLYALQDSKDVGLFLDDSNCKTLKVNLTTSGKLNCTCDLSTLPEPQLNDENSVDVLFFRRIAEPVTPDNITEVLDVQTVHGSPLDSLYNNLKSVWCPTLLDNNDLTQKLPPRVVQLLSELEQTLSSSSRATYRSGRNMYDDSTILEEFASINEVEDEVRFWQDLKSDRNSNLKDLASSVVSALQEVESPGFMDIDALDFIGVSDLVNRTFDALNGVWSCVGNDNQVYPQKRMEHFFDVIGKSLTRYIQRKLGDLDIWQNKNGDVRIQLLAALRICKQWCEVPVKLTRSFWKGSDHNWNGEEHSDTYMMAFRDRIEHVLRIRTLSDELSQLLTAEERQHYQLDRLFAPLEDTRPLLYNPYTDPAWLKAVADYEKAIDPVESAVAQHFRRNVSTILDHPQLLLREFQKYRNLMERNSIRRTLMNERDILLSLLQNYLKRLENSVDRIESGQDDDDETDSSIGRATNRARLLSPRLAGIIHLRQISSKVSSVLTTTSGLLDDLDTYASFQKSCESLISRIKLEEDNRYDSWLNEMQNKIDDDDEALRLQGSLMGWKDGILVVNFSDELVQFLREVRQLDELGFDIPRSSGRKSGKNRSMKVADKALEAEKYYRYGILLKKTANFYNSINEQMIDVQEQLLLDSLSAFGNVVSKPSLTRDSGDVSWSNPAECENYIQALQEAAEKLSSENRWLRKVHESLCDQTVSLMQIDLLRSTETWKAKWRSIKEKMNVVKTRYNEKDSRMWIHHWDHQIYKALECAYQLGLESLNENLPEIRIELVFNNKKLDLKPPLAQVRQNYYYEMKKFAGMPNSFEGFGNKELYMKMSKKNSGRLVKVYEKAEGLFDKLSKILAKYTPMARLGQLDLDAFIEKHVTTPESFLHNFKALRSKRKDVDKLPDVEKVDCVTISLTPFKGFLEDLLQRVADSLLVTLRRSVLQDFKEVDTFLENAMDRLSTRPHTVDEIGNAKKGWKEIDTNKDGMIKLSKACVEKKKILLQYAPGTAVDVSEVTQRMTNLDGEGGRWDDFDIALEAFNDMIEEQKEALKGQLEDDTITLNQQIDKFGNRWKQLKPTEVKSWEYDEVERIFVQLDDWKKQFAELEGQATSLTDNMVTFGMAKPRFEGLEGLVEDLADTNRSWDMLKVYYEELNVMAEQDWLMFSTNVYALQDFATKWADNLKEQFAKGSYDNVADHIITTVEMIKKSMPALKYCRGEPFKEDHWTELLQGKLKLDRDVTREKVKVSHFISTKSLQILMEPSTLSFVKNLEGRALGEVLIREALQELRAWERSAEIKLLDPDESGRKVPLIKDWKDMFVEMGDKQSLLASLKESEFFQAFKDQGLALESKMSTLDFVLHTLNSIQRKWVYLEPIFGRGALPSEEARFRRVDEDFTDIMTGVMRDPKLFYLADEQIFPQLTEKCKVMLDQLERCQKALTDFLEQKRSAMPRFYFIGDDDLLEILGQAKNPNVIQSHLKKLFQGIFKVQFNDESATSITAMVSSAGEVVRLEEPVPVNEKVEDWLEMLAVEMRSTLSALLARCLKSTKFNWDFPSQILCLATNIRFCDDCEAAIEEGHKGLENLHKNLNAQLRDLTSHDLSDEPLMQLKMKSLVLDVVHNIDMCEQLMAKRGVRLTDWVWQKQLRYYFEKNKAIVKMHDAVFDYTYEYQGNAPKLVHTPLTDKCYLTLTQGMHMGFGGNPYGPAGTGKTESVKALAACMGRQVLVFNCDEALESASMVRIFVGIVKCGAWGCFDEFNRLKEDQLSAISQQIQVIQDSIKMKTTPITLLGKEVNVDFNSGIFVTLNPAGKGYGGRSRLPDNLKALFRPVAMGAPDNELIAEVSLVTEGFTQSKDLASKIVNLFKLSKQLLSSQQHYDWGLRALKAVLNSGGRLIQSYKSEGSTVDAETEYEILIKAVRVNTLSKLTFADTERFLSLIADVFPGVKSSDITGGELEAAIQQVIKEKPFHLVEDSAQIKKMIQLKESLDQRMGCVIVGPSGCGKSTLWRVLKAAMMKCGKRVVTHVMNPKSMHRERLLGHMDLDTREWSDGVLTDAARKVVRESNDVACWIICDGDVDPEWIESLNSVLDDNHLLTLPNGERINFGPNVNFLFETHDLRFASPATVSRMGMIFLSDEDMDVARIVTRWVSSFPNERQLALTGWIDELFYKALDFVVRHDYVVDTTLVGTVMNGLSQVTNATSRSEFICGLIRGLGGNLSIPQRISLAKEVFQWSGERPPDMGQPLDCYADGNSFAPFFGAKSGNNDYIDVKDIGEKAVILTTTAQRTLKVMEAWIDNMEPFILVGPEGCGKSMLINYAFRQKKNVGIATIHCNAQTTADDIINKIAQSCSLFSSPEGRVYRPRDCERLVLYLKDVNLPRPDMYDTCQLIAFLQQLITFGGFYDEDLEFLRLERIQIVASQNAATTVGRHQLSTRFTAVVRVLAVDYPEPSELIAIYDAFLGSVLNSVSVGDGQWKQSGERERLSAAMVEIYQRTREKFTVDDRRHYVFNPRDVTMWVKNLCRYDLESENLLDVIAHEANRIFRDRLVGADAASRFEQQVNSSLRTTFRHTLTINGVYFTSLTTARGVQGGDAGEGKEGGGDNALSASIGGKLNRMSEEDFRKLVSQGVMYYEREERDLNMLLFTESLEHVAHIDRILSSLSGHTLLVGRCGVGRRNATTIASYMLGYEFYTPSVGRDYGTKQFVADIKAVSQVAGIKAEHVVFFLEDFQFTTESMLEMVNSLLSSGEVPGIYTHEELEPMLAPLKEQMREEGTHRTAYDFYVSRVRKYLHIVICMDPGHPRFLYRCESNPALYSKCSVQWIGDWRNQSLKVIPQLMPGIASLIGVAGVDNDGEGEGKDGEYKDGYDSKSGNESKGGGNEEIRNAVPPEVLTDMILSVHNSCIPRGANPRDYLVFLNSWHSLYHIKRKELQENVGHLDAGLYKLDSAAEVVNDLRTNAQQQQKDLAVAQTAADRAMEEISRALANSSDRRSEVVEVRKTVAENTEETEQRKKVIEGELAEIQPILDEAKEAVGGIKSNDLNEIRSFAAPPEAIQDVLAAVLTLLSVQDLSWLSMKKFLGSRGVKDDILNFDARRITPELRKNVLKLIKARQSSFETDNIRRVSQAAAPMAAWVLANIRYSTVLEKIQPLERDLEEQVFALEQSQNRLKKCEEELQEIDDRVSQLKSEFAEKTAEAERLKRNLSLAGETLDKAEGLIGQLSGEQTRWKVQAAQIRKDIANLPLRMLMAAGFNTYLAKEAEDVRESALKGWQDTIASLTNNGDNDNNMSFIFKRVMSTESELLQWKSMGLPSDDLSQENALVINSTTDRIPFIIDPASAATEWLKCILGQNKTMPLEVVSHHDARFNNQVELAVRFGKTLLILEVDGVEAMLYPLCRKDLRHQGPRNVVSVGEKTIDYNENFRLYLVTRNPQPDIPPDAAALVTQVNFSVTRSGLEGQLLGLAIQHEQPELEKQKGEMLKREEDFKVQIAGLERDLLQALATADGNLLENAPLIESLSKTKEKAAEIEEALEQSAKASVELDTQREVYRPLAHAGSKLFFIIKTLHTVNHMYQFSLSSFLVLFKQSLEKQMDKVRVEERLEKLCLDLEVRSLYFVGRALFKADRLMFGLHLVKGMHPENFQPREWEIFTGAVVSSVSESVPRGFPSWAANDRQAAYRVLVENAPHLIEGLELGNASKWQRFATSLEAEKDIPSLRGVSAFQRVLVIQAFRPDRLQSALTQFCTDLLRIESVSPPPLSLPAFHKESEILSSTSPLLLIQSQGSDASKELQEYAAKSIGLGSYHELAMGGGQQEVAIRMLQDAAQNGTWLCLKNLHLVVSWLPTLEKQLSSLQPAEGFKLWLTTEEHASFPSILLQESLKSTFESPPGIKKNLQRTFDSWDSNLLSDDSTHARLMYLLAAFHAVVQERRTYLPQGWTKAYEFSYGDIKAGTMVMEAATNFTKKGNRPVDWEAVHGLMVDAIYGGRVDNSFDLRVLKSYLTVFFNEDMISNESSGKDILRGTPLKMPSGPDLPSFYRAIESLPDSDAPYIFGLPDNIERSLQRNLSSVVIKQLRTLSSVDVEGDKFDREKWRTQLGPMLEAWQNMVSSSPGILLKKNYGDDNASSSKKSTGNPVDDFVLMEAEFAGNLCTSVDNHMISLKKVLFGSGLLSPAIQSIATSLLTGIVPSAWTKIWDAGPEKPQVWLRELVRKRLALIKWNASCSKGGLLNQPLNLGELFNPATFVNALRQQTARKLGTAIDRMKMTCAWDRDINSLSSASPVSCTLSGLLLQGASFQGVLQETRPEANELTTAPDVCIAFISKDAEEVYDSNRSIMIPTYLSTSREDYIMEMRMPLDSNRGGDGWVLSGVAVFLTEEQ